MQNAKCKIDKNFQPKQVLGSPDASKSFRGFFGLCSWNDKTQRAGFTLIELIVAFSIIAILSFLAIASFARYGNSQVLKSASDDLSATLNSAKSNSLSQLISFPTTNCLNKRLDGYEVIITLPITYKINVVCSGDHYQVLAKSLPNNTVFDPISQTSFFFPVLTGGVIGSGTVVLSGYGQTKSVTVTDTGVIK